MNRHSGATTGLVASGGADRDAQWGASPVRRVLAGFVALALSAGMLAACGSSTPSTSASDQARQGTCKKVEATLSDGPDPRADPVGYALAQIGPLQSVASTATGTLRGAIDHLVAAFQLEYHDNARNAVVNDAVQRALAEVNGLCPGDDS
ncbi:MAG: hypothetical protein ABSB09_13880 [Acidimicrobiales bacterium]